MREYEDAPRWENCRGIGFSFGYNSAEDERHSLTGRQLACHLVEVVSRGGRLLLNVGPTAEGEIPELQKTALGSLGRWMAQVGDVIRASGRVARNIAQPTNEPWVRWLDTPEHLVALVDRTGETTLAVHQDTVAAGEAEVRAAAGTLRSGAGSSQHNGLLVSQRSCPARSSA